MQIARLAWDSTQQQTPNLSSQIPTGQFSQPVIPYQNQNSYNQTQQGPPHYQQNYQQNKSDVCIICKSMILLNV